MRAALWVPEESVIFTYRPATAADRPFIVSGWSASYRMSRNETRPMALYAKQKHEEVNYYLDRAGVETLVAEGSVLTGFITFERPDYVMYCYVAQPFRLNGIARALLAEAGIDPATRFRYACQTRASWEVRNKIPLAVHDSLHARYSPEENEQHEREHRRERKGRRA